MDRLHGQGVQSRVAEDCQYSGGDNGLADAGVRASDENSIHVEIGNVEKSWYHTVPIYVSRKE